jgi:hypothetical protein
MQPDCFVSPEHFHDCDAFIPCHPEHSATTMLAQQH